MLPIAIVVSTLFTSLAIIHLADRIGAAFDRIADAIREHARTGGKQ